MIQGGIVAGKPLKSFNWVVTIDDDSKNDIWGNFWFDNGFGFDDLRSAQINLLIQTLTIDI